MTAPRRCAWADVTPAMAAYHDAEWGVARHDDTALFEALSLEGAQAGLSWRTVLERREAYRQAYLGFDIPLVAALSDAALEAILAAGAVIRHRGKIVSVRDNARAALGVIAAEGSLDRLLWSFAAMVPAATPPGASETDASRAMSRELRRRGFRFVGPTICHAFMQAVGMLDGHAPECFRARPG
jgi:DNA-3-methyladenine glycosylase I